MSFIHTVPDTEVSLVNSYEFHLLFYCDKYDKQETVEVRQARDCRGTTSKRL